MLDRWKITPAEFDEALRHNPTDDSLYQWFEQRVRAEDVQAANAWLQDERMENLERQDAEEGAVAEHR